MKKFSLTILCDEVILDDFDNEMGNYLESVRDSVLYTVEEYENLTVDTGPSSYMELTGSRHHIDGTPGTYCTGVVVEVINIVDDEIEPGGFDTVDFCQRITESIKALDKTYFNVVYIGCHEIK